MKNQRKYIDVPKVEEIKKYTYLRRYSRWKS